MTESEKILDLRQVQRAELDILLCLRDFCDAYGLRYSLAGGTLLGAIRHKGFIPWDDDVDVSMPRPDYERLIVLREDLKSETGMDLLGFQELDLEVTPFMKMVNPAFRAKSAGDLKGGYLWIDIFPVDGVPSQQKDLVSLFGKVQLFRHYVSFITCPPESNPDPLQRLSMRLLPPLIRAIPGSLEWGVKKLTRLSKAVPYSEADYVATVGWGLYGIGERMKKAEYEKSAEVAFENETFTIMDCWDSYLTGLYGDYMQLPPESEQKTHGLKVRKL